MRCQECNYDLTGVDSEYCPECGAGAHPMRLLRPDDAFETLVRVLGTWFAATTLVAMLMIAVDAGFRHGMNARFATTQASIAPSLLMGVYLLLFAPQIRRLCYRDARPRGYTPRAVFHLVAALVGVWLTGRGIADISRNALLELFATRPSISVAKIAGQAPRVVVGFALMVGAGWLSRVWR